MRKDAKTKWVKSNNPKRCGGGLENRIERDEKMKKLVELRLEGVGLRECAEILGYNEQTIGRWHRSPLFQTMFEATRYKLLHPKKVENAQERAQRRAYERLQNVDKLIDQYSVDAIRTINVKMRRSADERIQLRAAQDLADRGARTAKTKKVQQTSLHAILTPEMLASMAKTASQIRNYGKPVEAIELPNDDVIIDSDDDESQPA